MMPNKLKRSVLHAGTRRRGYPVSVIVKDE